MPNRTIKMPATPWAESAVDVPVTPTTGVTYRNYDLSDEESDNALPYKTIIQGANVNEIVYRLTALMQMLEFNGVLPWCAGITYGEYAWVTGSDGKQYRSLQAANINHDPTASPTWWVDLDSLYYVQGAAWTSYVPTITALTGTLTTVSGSIKYVKIGKTVHARIYVLITDVGTGGGAIIVTLPLEVNVVGGAAHLIGSKNNDGTTVYGICSNTTIYIYKYDGTFPGASGMIIEGSLTYETIE